MGIDFLEKAFALAQAKRITFREACQELGRRGALVRNANRRKKKWAGLSLIERQPKSDV